MSEKSSGWQNEIEMVACGLERTGFTVIRHLYQNRIELTISPPKAALGTETPYQYPEPEDFPDTHFAIR